MKLKGSLTNLIALAVFVPTLLVLFMSTYLLYVNFNKFEEVKTQQKYLELTKKLENLLVYLGQERGASSIYSVSKGNYPNSRQLLAQKRKEFSNAIQELKDFVKKNPQMYNNVKDVLQLTDQLPQIRAKIDTFKENYIKTYFFSYYTALENKIINDIAKIEKKFPPSLQKIYALKFPFERIISYSGIVRGFGAYYITADVPMSQNEYMNVLMKYYHDSNLLPIELLDSKSKQYFQNKEFEKIEKDIKVVLFYIQQANMEYYIDGNFEGYPIDVLDYFKLFTKRINTYKKVISDLNNKINLKEQEILKTAKTKLAENAIVTIIALLILLIGIYIVKLINSHINELSHLISSLTPVVGEKTDIDVSSAKGLNEAIKIVDEALKIIQESVRRAEEATKAKSLFLANMSHEIRTPLNGILGFLEILKTTELTPEQEEYVNTISQSAKNLLQIVNNILDVSKIESNKITLETIDFKAIDEFESTLEIFASPAAQKNIQYVAYISPNIPKTLKGDILKIKEILTNLINNAIKFTHDNGTISVKILLEKIQGNKASIYFEVKDTGIGMSEEQKQKIFEAFAQADESVTRKYGGTGLGLTIVKSYIEMMGGEIQVDSEINKGSKFYFTLDFEISDPTPRYKQNSFSHFTFAIMNTLKESLRKEFTLEYLSYFGVQRIGFNNKEELKQIAQNEKIDAVLVFFEESDKEEIIKLKELDIPIITVSSFALKEKINELNPETTIYDPTLPSKTYSAITSSKEKKVIHKKEERKEEVKIAHKLRALIAEDNPINLKLLQTKLKSMGIESDSANNGLEAFNKYSMNPEKYDVIFMDAQMPVMDGIEATQEILEFEQEEGIPHTPIIAVTANALKGDREKFIGAGMDDYISKPIEQRELDRVIDNIIHKRYTKSSEEVEEVTQNIQKEQPEPKEETTSKIEKTEKENIVIASESTFLLNYLKNVLDIEFKTATNIKELQNNLDKEAQNILILEEDFNGADTNTLINSIKSEVPNTKIIIISEQEFDNCDGIISDLDPEKIKEILNSIKGKK